MTLLQKLWRYKKFFFRKSGHTNNTSNTFKKTNLKSTPIKKLVLEQYP